MGSGRGSWVEGLSEDLPGLGRRIGSPPSDSEPPRSATPTRVKEGSLRKTCPSPLPLYFLGTRADGSPRGSEGRGRVSEWATRVNLQVGPRPVQIVQCLLGPAVRESVVVVPGVPSVVIAGVV